MQAIKKAYPDKEVFHILQRQRHDNTAPGHCSFAVFERNRVVAIYVDDGGADKQNL